MQRVRQQHCLFYLKLKHVFLSPSDFSCTYLNRHECGATPTTHRTHALEHGSNSHVRLVAVAIFPSNRASLRTAPSDMSRALCCGTTSCESCVGARSYHMIMSDSVKCASVYLQKKNGVYICLFSSISGSCIYETACNFLNNRLLLVYLRFNRCFSFVSPSKDILTFIFVCN